MHPESGLEGDDGGMMTVCVGISRSRGETQAFIHSSPRIVLTWLHFLRLQDLDYH